MWQPAAPVNPTANPPHVQIARAIEEAHARGELVVGERLPAERDLAAAFGVSRMTLRHALDTLAQDGVVERRPGRGGGTFIAESRIELTGLAALSDQLRGLGLRAGARVVEAVERAASGDELATLGHSRVYVVRRVRYAAARVIALERTVLPAPVYPGLLDHPLAGSLYALLRKEYGTVPVRAVERLEATLVRSDEAEPLQLEVGAPILLVHRVAYGEDGTALELSHDLYRSDRTRVTWESSITSNGE